LLGGKTCDLAEIVGIGIHSGADDLLDLIAGSSRRASRRIKAEIDDRTSVWMVSADDLVLLKLIANRPRDFIDFADVLFVQGQLDAAYMTPWANRLGIPERLHVALKTEN